ncbi:transposase [Streptomyces sp. NPDC057011]|uniref:transposase n=1 Tax=unclassified Streptomyces TaxID=2593676 RepID=UPI00363FD851
MDHARSVAERMLQELIEAGVSAHIGAGWNQHTASRTALRNGHRDKTLITPAGTGTGEWGRPGTSPALYLLEPCEPAHEPDRYAPGARY